MFSRFVKWQASQKPGPPVVFMADNPQYAAHEIGQGTYGTPHVISWDDRTRLRIGKYCSIADGVVILLGGEHRTDWITTYPFSVLWPEAQTIKGHPRTRGDVMIENDVWIGREAMILSGVRIGDGAVIGARSVVTKDVAPYTIVAGNPARVIRQRFSTDQICALLKIAWWNWDKERLQLHLPLLLSENIDEFIKTAGATNQHGNYAAE